MKKMFMVFIFCFVSFVIFVVKFKILVILEMND